MFIGARRLVLTALICLAAAVPVHATIVSIAPSTTSALVGQSLLVEVNVANLVDGAAPSLSGFDITLNFDPGVLGFAGITFGSGLDVLGSGDNLQESIVGANSVNAFELSLDTVDDLNNLQLGAFTLFTVAFDAIAEGTSELSLTLNSLADAAAIEIDAQTLGASINVAPVPLPAAVWLFLGGIGLVGTLARRRGGAR